MNITTAYQYDSMGFFIADESPREPGIFLLPSRCTLQPPPADVPDDQWPRWNGATWVLVNKPERKEAPDPVAKLKEFIAANPDVAALLS